MRRLDAPGRARLDTLMPRLLAAIADRHAWRSRRRSTCCGAILRVLEAIGSRSAYFALLNENRTVRRKLVELAARGEFLAAQIASHPLLLDELLDESSGGLPAPRAELEAEVTARLAHLAEDEPERQVEVLRQFQRAAIFRVAMADLTGKIPLMRVSDYLTEIAEIIVEQAMRLAWTQMTAQFGVPQTNNRDGPGRRAVNICAVGYGKLGGNELGYASDLDLVFLHDAGCRAFRDRCREAGGQPGVLHPLRAARHAPAHHAFGRRAALRSRRAAAALGQGRHVDHARRRVRRIPGEGGLDLGAPGAAACARGGRRCERCAPSSSACASMC